MKMLTILFSTTALFSLYAAEPALVKEISSRVKGDLAVTVEFNKKIENANVPTSKEECLQWSQKAELVPGSSNQLKNLCSDPQKNASSIKYLTSSFAVQKVDELEKHLVNLQKLPPSSAVAEDLVLNSNLYKGPEACRQTVDHYLSFAKEEMNLVQKKQIESLCQAPEKNMKALKVVLSSHLSKFGFLEEKKHKANIEEFNCIPVGANQEKVSCSNGKMYALIGSSSELATRLGEKQDNGRRSEGQSEKQNNFILDDQSETIGGTTSIK